MKHLNSQIKADIKVRKLLEVERAPQDKRTATEGKK